MIVRFATFTFDSDRRLLLDDRQKTIHITPKAFDLLAVLIAAAPRVVTKVELHERLWPGTFVADATLVGLVKELRRALDDHDPQARVIRTSHGVGYAFCGTLVSSTGVSEEPQHWVVVGNDRRVPLQPGENVIGRDPVSTLWLDMRGVSRRHARIVIAGRQARIEDLGSKNGTMLRGALLTTPAVLRDGDDILVGPIALQYRVSVSGMSTDTIALPSQRP
jgi:DNA-binding winged helix-turn-helix (wHTH) protein